VEVPAAGSSGYPAIQPDTQHWTALSFAAELCYERAYVVLPPLAEWLRVASAHAEHRNGLMIDKDDILQVRKYKL